MRIFTDETLGENCVLTGGNHRHVAYALRSKVGDEMVLCPQDGYDYHGVIEKISSDKTVVRILKKVRNESEPTLRLTVYSAVMNKGEKMDLVAQKLTELGVARIVPLMTRFVQEKAQSVRLDRLNKICSEAAKQCNRGIIPEVLPVMPFSQMTKEITGYDLVVFPYEREEKRSLKEFLLSIRRKSESAAKKIVNVAVVIGAEGGFSEDEAAELKARGVVSVTLGRRILRAETANIAVVSALMYELDEWQRCTREENT